MTDTIIVALITGGISLLGVIVSNVATHRKTMALIEYKLKELRDDLTTLSKRVDEHNHLVERMAAVEQHKVSTPSAGRPRAEYQARIRQIQI